MPFFTRLAKISAVLYLFAGIASCGTAHEKEESGNQSDAAAADVAQSNTALDYSTVTVFSTARDSESRLGKTAEASLVPAEQPLETELAIVVNPEHSFQEYWGMGGAITDATAEVFAQLSSENQQKLLKAYFHPTEGIGYTVIRTTIHSCDFSPYSYTYIAEGDTALATFDISHDEKFRIPMIQSALALIGTDAKVYASPWSPPPFMKTNGQMLEGGKLKPELRQAWANYYVKFIKAYEASGVPIWGITVQNEPMARQRWESCIYTAEEEKNFLKNYLGPTLHSSGLGDTKVVVWDHNRDLIAQRAFAILDDSVAASYVWGVGFHWYEVWTGSEPMHANVALVSATYPDKHLLFTEGCVEKFDPEKYQHWPNAERYGMAVINDFNAGSVGWTDWNILLNERGGPNHVGNYCFAPVHADVATDSLIFTPSYYYLGHFSKFMKPGAKRIATSTSRSTLMATSFRNPDGQMLTVVLNTGDEPADYSYYIGDEMSMLRIPAHAIQTLVNH